MIKINDIQEWADDLRPILFDISLSLNNLRLLDHERLNKFRINYGNTYLTLLYQQHFILVIQLAKLFSKKNDTHKRNINKLINRFQNEKLSRDVLSTLDSINVFKNKDEILATIGNFKEKIVENSETIESILSLRDKVFAHTDPNGIYFTIEIQSYSILVELCNEIYNTLIGNISDKEFNPNFVNKYDLRNLLDLLER